MKQHLIDLISSAELTERQWNCLLVMIRTFINKCKK